MSQTALIVEDEIFVALDLERILTDAGYNVAGIAADSRSAIECAPGCTFAFVDVNLRDGATGPEIARRIAEDYGVKIVFVTANPSQIDTGIEALGYIRKPFSERAILAAAALATGGGQAAPEDVIPLGIAM
ncbi:transcriptional regulator [Sphingomonas yabuuchiae]|jgi:CheY-like chemotaxis protein|uniref:Transcriptional regulator n=1 Tax=Sphingomonas yabuuchiae TaxID=172044 RepID=A0A147IQI9_9SPHN|nr:response regulator [Sphingomonas yabuuchiae]KTT97621.1 transcriptional regulator [Sphingomonas yabuuchiae]